MAKSFQELSDRFIVIRPTVAVRPDDGATYVPGAFPWETSRKVLARYPAGKP